MVRVKQSHPRHLLNDSVEFRWRMRNVPGDGERARYRDSYRPVVDSPGWGSREVPFYVPVSPIERKKKKEEEEEVDSSIEIVEGGGPVTRPSCAEWEVRMERERVHFLRMYGLMRRFIALLADLYDPGEWDVQLHLHETFMKVLQRHSRMEAWQHFLNGFQYGLQKELGYTLVVNLEEEYEELSLSFELSSKFHGLTIPPAARKRKLKVNRMTATVMDEGSPLVRRLRPRVVNKTKERDE